MNLKTPPYIRGGGALLACATALASGNNARWQECQAEAARMVQRQKVFYPGCDGARNEYLAQRWTMFNPPAFNLATNTILGTTQRWAIDRTWPIEEIIIWVNFDVTTGFTTTSSTTPDMFDNILSIIQKVNLSVNDGRQPRSVVDISGVGLLEYASQVGWNLDEATTRMLAISANPVGALAVPVGVYQMCYRIPMVDPQISEPLRTRCYLPVHTFPQDPVLSLTFNTLAGMSAVATGAIGTIRVDVQLIRRLPTTDSEKLLRSTAGSNPNGYIDWDLIETPFTVALGTSAETRFPLPVPGNYLNLLFRQYKGGAAPLSRAVPIDVDTGVSIATNLGQETRWRLETGQVVLRDWRWKHMRTVNDWTRPANVLAPTTALTLPTPTNEGFVGLSSGGAVTAQLTNQTANFGLLQAATANYRGPTSCMMNFLNDGVTGEGGNELGSLLDCNTPANNGLKMEIIGTPASVATNPSVLFVAGRRLFGDISRWQKF